VAAEQGNRLFEYALRPKQIRYDNPVKGLGDVRIGRHHVDTDEPCRALAGVDDGNDGNRAVDRA
jgi:hypothetical protein